MIQGNDNDDADDEALTIFSETSRQCEMAAKILLWGMTCVMNALQMEIFALGSKGKEVQRRILAACKAAGAPPLHILRRTRARHPSMGLDLCTIMQMRTRTSNPFTTREMRVPSRPFPRDKNFGRNQQVFAG
jgi:hypothetical protein